MMNTTTLTLWTAIAIVIFLMATDNNFYNWFLLQLKIIPLNIKRYYYMAILHPKNPLTTWYFNYRIQRVLKKYNA